MNTALRLLLVVSYARISMLLAQAAPTTSSGAPATQISDGQPQAPTAGAPVTQISDGQPQASNATPVSQLSDGQPQVSTAAVSPQISDGQPQAAPTAGSSPSVTIPNGTFVGLYNPTYDQDLFLGIPYAQPPLNDLRFNLPASLNTSFSEPQDAKAYSPECVGYGVDQMGYDVSEDCLTMNVVRPAGYENASLPVMVWIHGGGYIMGGAADKRYNLTFLVQQSVALGKPIIAASFQYRLTAWGFLAGSTVQQAGLTNLGLKDQRLALHWIQENIQAFGGDPSKVTIWGESAGGSAVGYQAQAYGGRDDGLFRAIIAESIWENRYSSNMTQQNVWYNMVLASTGCNTSSDTLACLRSSSFDTLNKAFNTTPTTLFGPVVDGDFIPDITSNMLREGRFVKVPLLVGANTDEGTSFGPKGIDNDTAFANYVSSTGPDANETTILETLYPDILSIGIPETLHGRPNSTYGSQYKRSSAFAGDFVIHAPRRAHSQAWSQQSISSYSFRFNVLVAGLTQYSGSNHFQEFAFVADNTQGLGYGDPNPAYPNPFAGKPQSYFDLANLMSRMWVSFVHDLNPNNHNVPGVPQWPIYDTTNGYAREYVFDANVTSYVEVDNYRAEAIQYMIDESAALFNR